MPQPAARVSDMHVCPMVTPAVPPVPHVGGPILPPGAVTVLIGRGIGVSSCSRCAGTGRKMDREQFPTALPHEGFRTVFSRTSLLPEEECSSQ
jgi:hypothetical protein